MGKQGTLHPRKHPCSSAGVVPEHTHKQTDSDTHRNPHAQRVLPFPKSTHLLPLYSPASRAQAETEATPLTLTPTPHCCGRNGFGWPQPGLKSLHHL